MKKVLFRWNESEIIIECKPNETFEEICIRYLKALLIDKKIFILKYLGKEIDLKKTYSEIINNYIMNSNLDKKKNLVPVDVSERLDIEKENSDVFYSNQIICPKCSENCFINIQDFRIRLYNCLNNHRKYNILLGEFEKTQRIKISDIICHKCKISYKNKSVDNKFYICINCNKYFCKKCKLEHDNQHILINYEKKNYICKSHSRYYDSYCEDCKKNICIICYQDHDKHKKISYGNILPKSSELSGTLNNITKAINSLNNNINEIINKLKEIKNNLSIYLKLKTKLINNFNYKNINYEIIYNLNNIYEKDNIINKLDIVNNSNNIIQKFVHLMKIYEQITNNDLNINFNQDINTNIILGNLNDLINLDIPEINKKEEILDLEDRESFRLFTKDKKEEDKKSFNSNSKNEKEIMEEANNSMVKNNESPEESENQNLYN